MKQRHCRIVPFVVVAIAAAGCGGAGSRGAAAPSARSVHFGHHKNAAGDLWIERSSIEGNMNVAVSVPGKPRQTVPVLSNEHTALRCERVQTADGWVTRVTVIERASSTRRGSALEEKPSRTLGQTYLEHEEEGHAVFTHVDGSAVTDEELSELDSSAVRSRNANDHAVNGASGAPAHAALKPLSDSTLSIGENSAIVATRILGGTDEVHTQSARLAGVIEGDGRDVAVFTLLGDSQAEIDGMEMRLAIHGTARVWVDDARTVDSEVVADAVLDKAAGADGVALHGVGTLTMRTSKEYR